MPMRHGLTLGELGHWFIRRLRLDVEYRVIAMQGWQPAAAPGYGWPLGERTWVNPSPNAPNLSMARCYAGTVMLEGTTLSEGRGTTRPLELFGAPDLDAGALRRRDAATRAAVAARLPAAPVLVRAHVPQARRASSAPACRSTSRTAPTTTRRSGRGGCRRWRSRRCARCTPTTTLWRDFPYEYEHDRLAIDLINGSELLRQWVDDAAATPGDLDALATPDEDAWRERTRGRAAL